MSDLNTEIKITASADGVETGVARAKRSLASLKEEATRSGTEAGRGMAPLGDGAEAAARKVDSATRSMQNSLQRQIAALEAGGTATRQYQESLAKLRGVDANALKPLLDQLDAAKAKADRAGQGLNGLGTASSFLQGQLAALAGSLTLGSMAAFVLQINNGIDALNDIKDATGSTIENISALEDIGKRTGASLDLVGGVLIKFNDVLSKATPKSDIALQLQAIGLSAEELKRIDPAEALLKTAQALSQYADDGNKARLIQDLFGKSVKEAAPFLADLAEKGQLVAKVTTQQADEADRFNKQLFEMQANIQEASRRLAGPLVSAINEVAKAFREGSASGKGFFEIASDRYWSNVRGFYNGEGVMSGSRPVRNPREATGTIRVEAGAAATEPPKPSIVLGPTAAEIAEQERRERERQSKAEAAARAAAALRERELKEQQKFFADLAGLSGDYYDKLAQAQKERAAGNITEAQYIEYVEQLIQKQPFATALTRDNAKALKDQNDAKLEASKASVAYYAALGQDLNRLDEQNERLRQESEQFGLTAEGLLALTLARQDHAIAIEAERLALLQANEGSAGEILLQERRIALLKEQRALTAANGQRQIATDAAKEAAAAWRKASDDIERSLTDALMRGFESGKDFVRNLRDTAVNLFKTLVFRPIISAVVSPVAGAITGSLGLAGAANAATAGNNLMGTAGTLSTAYNALSTGISNSITAGFNKLALSSVGESLGLSSSSNYAPGLTSAGSNIGTALGMAGSAFAGYGLSRAIGGGYQTGLGGTVDAIGTIASAFVGPLAGVVSGLVNRAFGRKLKDQGLQGEFGGEAGFTGESYQFYKGGWFRSDKTTTTALDAEMQSGLANQFNALRAQTALMATVLGETGQSVADFTSRIKLSFNGLTEAQINEKLAETFANIGNDLAKTVLGDSAFAKEGEAASQTLQRLATSLTTVNGTFDALGFSLEAVSLAGADAASDFIDLIGGLDAFKAAAAGYYANFYTETERQAKATEQLTAQLAALGQSMPATRDGFRALVEAAEKAGDNALLAGLLNLQDEFAALVPAAEDAAAAVSSAVSSLKEESKRLQRDLLVATGGDVRAYDTLYMSAAERALYDYNQSLRDQISAANAATRANEAAADAAARAAEEARARAAAVAQGRAGLERQLLEATGNTAAIRALELAALDATNRALQEHIWAIEDAAAAYEKATTAAQAAYNTLERSVGAERDRLTGSYNAQRDAITAQLQAQQAGYQAQIAAAQDAADKIRDIASALATAVGQVRVDSPTLNRAAYDAARGVIGTGNINDPRLQAALQAVSGDNKQFYGRFEDYAFDQAVTAANIKSMDAAAQSQLSTAQAMIESLKASDTLAKTLADAQLAAMEEQHQEDLAKLQAELDMGKAQLDALLGVDNSVMSVADAVNNLSAAISAAYAAQAAQIAASSAAQSTVSAETFVSSDDAAYRALIDAQGKALNDAKGSAAFWESIGVDGEKGAALAASDRAAVAAGRYDRVGAADVLGLDGKAVNDAIYKYAVASNPLLFDSSAGAALSNAGSGYVPPGLRDELLKTLGIPGFDVGINRVPHDMFARIHEGKAVVPAQFNPFNPGAATFGNAEVLAELRQLNERMARIEATNAATAGHTAATDRKLARVIRNDAMVTEALPA